MGLDVACLSAEVDAAEQSVVCGGTGTSTWCPIRLVSGAAVRRCAWTASSLRGSAGDPLPARGPADGRGQCDGAQDGDGHPRQQHPDPPVHASPFGAIPRADSTVLVACRRCKGCRDATLCRVATSRTGSAVIPPRRSPSSTYSQRNAPLAGSYVTWEARRARGERMRRSQRQDSCRKFLRRQSRGGSGLRYHLQSRHRPDSAHRIGISTQPTSSNRHLSPTASTSRSPILGAPCPGTSRRVMGVVSDQ